MISVVIRNKNQEQVLSFLLKNLTERYMEDIDEIIVIDNLSSDRSKEVANSYGAKVVTIVDFSYGGSANLAARSAKNNIIVIFSAHSYPVSHDFFKLIKERFKGRQDLAGLRCLHNTNDYKNYINKISANDDPNKSGLIFSGSAINKKVWLEHPFREDVATFEDKEWSKRVIEAGYSIEFVPSIFCYDIKRSKAQQYFRFKNDLVGNYQLWHREVSFRNAVNGLIMSTYRAIKDLIIELYYIIKRFGATINFLLNRPKKF